MGESCRSVRVLAPASASLPGSHGILHGACAGRVLTMRGLNAPRFLVLSPLATDDLAKVARLPPCDARRFQWTAEPLDASTTPRLSSAVPSLGHVMLPGIPVFIRGNRHGHSRDLAPFGHRSSPEAPSLRRHYPASPVSGRRRRPLGLASGRRSVGSKAGAVAAGTGSSR